MACCLISPSHHLNQRWLIISKVFWRHYHKKIWRFQSEKQDWELHFFQITLESPMDHWVKFCYHTGHCQLNMLNASMILELFSAMLPPSWFTIIFIIVNWTLTNKLQWNFNRNSNILNQENALENVVCEMASILSWPQCVKSNWLYTGRCRDNIDDAGSVVAGGTGVVALTTYGVISSGVVGVVVALGVQWPSDSSICSMV